MKNRKSGPEMMDITSSKTITIGNTIRIDGKHKLRLLLCFIVGLIILYAMSHKMFPNGIFSSSKLARTYERGYMFNSVRPTEGLVSRDKRFYLNHKPFKILSGSMHYFRVLPQYWRDRLQKMKACGLNTVTTYVAWNMHEPERGVFNFNGQADIRRFIQIAAEVGLYVILRPGPYICAEWDYGGLPSWLLRDGNMNVRSTYPGFLKEAQLFLEYVVYEVIDLQYTKGGPIIAVQVENEFGSFRDDARYMAFLKDVLVKKGINETLFSCNGATGIDKGWLPNHLMTANFGMKKKSGRAALDYIRAWNPDMALFVTEFWDGWFDHWSEHHQRVRAQDVVAMLKWMFEEKDVQGVNFYMFHGGTNFGFWNGANNNSKGVVQPTITSYDYDAPISEHGQMTQKCRAIREYFEKTIPKYAGSVELSEKDIHNDDGPKAYGSFQVIKYLPFKSLLPVFTTTMKSDRPVNMEMILANNRNGQSYGYTLYQTNFGKGKAILFSGRVRDRAIIYVNGKQIAVIGDSAKERKVDISKLKLLPSNKLEILVENLGRVNFFRNNESSINDQRKGIVGDVLLDKTPLKAWTITPIEFKQDQLLDIISLPTWLPFKQGQAASNQSAVYLIEVVIAEVPRDTFLKMPKWTKGVVFVNGFNLGRYWNIGPQQTLYLPAPVLKTGVNQFIVYELHVPGEGIELVSSPELGLENFLQAELIDPTIKT